MLKIFLPVFPPPLVISRKPVCSWNLYERPILIIHQPGSHQPDWRRSLANSKWLETSSWKEQRCAPRSELLCFAVDPCKTVGKGWGYEQQHLSVKLVSGYIRYSFTICSIKRTHTELEALILNSCFDAKEDCFFFLTEWRCLVRSCSASAWGHSQGCCGPSCPPPSTVCPNLYKSSRAGDRYPCKETRP